MSSWFRRRTSSDNAPATGVEVLEARRPGLEKTLIRQLDERADAIYIPRLEESTRVNAVALLARCSLWQGHGDAAREWADELVSHTACAYFKLPPDTKRAVLPFLPPPGAGLPGSVAADGSGTDDDLSSGAAVLAAGVPDEGERWCVVRDLLLCLVVEGRYDARGRAAMHRLAAALGVDAARLDGAERALAVELKQTLLELDDAEASKRSASGGRWKKYALVGSATVAGTAALVFTGGLAAPAVAAGIAALGSALGGVVAVGAAASAAFLASATGVAVVTTLFGVTGGGLAGYKMSRRVADLSRFDVGQAATGTHFSVAVCVPGVARSEANMWRMFGAAPPDSVADTEAVEVEETERGIDALEAGTRTEARAGTGGGGEGAGLGAPGGGDAARGDEGRRASAVAAAGARPDPEEGARGSGAEAVAPSRCVGAGESDSTAHGAGAPSAGAIAQTDASLAAGSGSGVGPASAAGAPDAGAGARAGDGAEAIAAVDGDARPDASAAVDGDARPDASAAVDGDARPDASAAVDGDAEGPPVDAQLSAEEPWWGEFAPSVEQNIVVWEPDVLRRVHGAVSRYLATQAAGYAASTALGATAAGALLSAFAWPALILQSADVIDNVYSIARTRATKAGRVLADALSQRQQGQRPVVLVGCSLGARAVLECVAVLEETMGARASAVVQHVYLFGTAASASSDQWRALRRVVPGRVVNVHSRKDWVLAFMHRVEAREQAAGVREVAVDGVENVDATHLISGHLEWNTNMRALLALVKADM